MKCINPAVSKSHHTLWKSKWAWRKVCLRRVTTLTLCSISLSLSLWSIKSNLFLLLQIWTPEIFSSWFCTSLLLVSCLISWSSVVSGLLSRLNQKVPFGSCTRFDTGSSSKLESFILLVIMILAFSQFYLNILWFFQEFYLNKIFIFI